MINTKELASGQCYMEYPAAFMKRRRLKVLFFEQAFDSHAACGAIGPDHFVTKLYHIAESNNYNTCMYKKISIDENGYLKHCPSMTTNYGKYSKQNLLNAMMSESYQKISSLKKDDITVCKICEFRHICTDCRAHVADPADIFSRPAKCRYNPLTAKWLL